MSRTDNLAAQTDWSAPNKEVFNRGSGRGAKAPLYTPGRGSSGVARTMYITVEDVLHCWGVCLHPFYRSD